MASVSCYSTSSSTLSFRLTGLDTSYSYSGRYADYDLYLNGTKVTTEQETGIAAYASQSTGVEFTGLSSSTTYDVVVFVYNSSGSLLATLYGSGTTSGSSTTYYYRCYDQTNSTWLTSGASTSSSSVTRPTRSGYTYDGYSTGTSYTNALSYGVESTSTTGQASSSYPYIVFYYTASSTTNYYYYCYLTDNTTCIKSKTTTTSSSVTRPSLSGYTYQGYIYYDTLANCLDAPNYDSTGTTCSSLSTRYPYVVFFYTRNVTTYSATLYPTNQNVTNLKYGINSTSGLTTITSNTTISVSTAYYLYVTGTASSNYKIMGWRYVADSTTYISSNTTLTISAGDVSSSVSIVPLSGAITLTSSANTQLVVNIVGFSNLTSSYYEMQFGTDSSFSTKTTWSNQSSGSKTVSNLSSGTTYYFRYRYYESSSKCSGWSNTYSFATTGSTSYTGNIYFPQYDTGEVCGDTSITYKVGTGTAQTISSNTTGITVGTNQDFKLTANISSDCGYEFYRWKYTVNGGTASYSYANPATWQSGWGSSGDTVSIALEAYGFYWMDSSNPSISSGDSFSDISADRWDYFVEEIRKNLTSSQLATQLSNTGTQYVSESKGFGYIGTKTVSAWLDYALTSSDKVLYYYMYNIVNYMLATYISSYTYTQVSKGQTVTATLFNRIQNYLNAERY